MSPKKIDHIAIICTDYEAARNFYVEQLGMQVVQETKRSDKQDVKLDLRFGDLMVELFIKPTAPKRLTYPEAAGLRHLCFKTEDIAADVAKLKAKGIRVEPIREDELNQRKMTFFFDPDDLPIELHE
ncbi:VOC family protein [Pediococcus acidilactici]|uniref:SMU1112c/YaeR family gloxylase I-like metalloprotein n=1 Tax=Pediococcus acidilactici TaxID=1254 RepID=UPI000E5D7E16|nr:VOC family protein [Pediococcus acidilactici]KAF0367959.1 VOC family protein [Pediococcus acidilactici]KAF0466467.1 VOC family protein [Pediococcus acidilactici]KAF0473172.1 VOC family protein [Pediococcus acidilactici]KAF0492263.1 VOC family protein [Pediococcus acidilactici]KAF0518510.1 VOC family protein [Pediococcus acidilactici]